MRSSACRKTVINQTCHDESRLTECHPVDKLSPKEWQKIQTKYCQLRTIVSNADDDNNKQTEQVFQDLWITPNLFQSVPQ